MPDGIAQISSATILTTGWRLLSVAVGSIVFSIAADWGMKTQSFAGAVGLALLFAVPFAGVPALRVVRFAWRGGVDANPVAWSDAVTATAIAMFVAAVVLSFQGTSPEHLICAFGLAINSAYLPAKSACLAAGCCHPLHHRRLYALALDLRLLELAATAAVLIASAIMLQFSTPLAGLLAVCGHLLVRVFSRWQRSLDFWTGDPLRPPLAEICALCLLAATCARALVVS